MVRYGRTGRVRERRIRAKGQHVRSEEEKFGRAFKARRSPFVWEEMSPINSSPRPKIAFSMRMTGLFP